MRRIATPRRIALPAAVAVAALVGAGAYAYFTAGGAGSATASVGAGTTLTVDGTTGGTLYPGSAVPVSFTVNNPAPGDERVGTVYLSGVKACTGAASSWDESLSDGAGGCSHGGAERLTCESFDPGDAADVGAGDFYMADVLENQTVAGSSAGVALTTAGRLEMNNLGSAQDSCESASIYLELKTR
jgi:hypothetical protein